MGDEFYQADQDQAPAAMIAVLQERTMNMGREIRELKEAQRRDMEEFRANQKALTDKLDAVLTTMSEARGGWRTLMLIGGASGSLGAGLAWILQHLGKGP